MKERPVVAAIGEVLWDVYPDATRFGGAPANFACHAAALGADAPFVSAVGIDDLGDRALAILAAHGVDASCVAREPNFATGQVAVALDSAGRASYRFATDSAWDHIGWSQSIEAVARQVDAVCFGTLGQRSPTSRSAIRQFVSVTPPGSLRMFDVNLRQTFYDGEVIDASLKLANAVKLNEEELPIVARMCNITASDQRHMLRQLVTRYDLMIAALTLGVAGAVLVTPEEESQCPGIQTPVVDTVGAGDAFTATMVIDLLHGVPLGEVNRHANAVASFVCSQAGAVSPLPADLLVPAQTF